MSLDDDDDARQGNLHFLDGKYADSIRFYDKAIALRPDNTVCLWYVPVLLASWCLVASDVLATYSVASQL
jgi:tetratricopeptide (TPR) repeat protein